MKIKEWFMAQKKKRMAKKQAKLERSLAREEENALEQKPVLRLDAEEPEMPKSRFTEEYKEFLKKQEQQAQEDSGPITREES